MPARNVSALYAVTLSASAARPVASGDSPSAGQDRQHVERPDRRRGSAAGCGTARRRRSRARAPAPTRTAAAPRRRCRTARRSPSSRRSAGWSCPSPAASASRCCQTTLQSRVMASRSRPPEVRDAAIDALDAARHRKQHAGSRRASRTCRPRSAGSSGPATVSDCRMSSGTAITDAIAVSLIVTDRSEPNAGSIRTTACGSTMRRRICARDMPSASAARVWPGRTDSMPGADDLGGIGREVHGQPEQRRPERRHRDAGDDRQREERPHQHDQHGNRAHRVDVEHDERPQPARPVQARERDDEARRRWLVTPDSAGERERDAARPTPRKRQWSVMTAKSKSIGAPAGPRRRVAARRRRYFIVSTTRASSALSFASISFSTARAQARNAGWFLSIAMPTGAAFSGAVLAVVVLRQHGELLELAAHRDPRHAVDRHRVGALRHHFLDRRDAGAGDAAQLRLREALLDPAFLAAARVVRDRDLGLD